MIYILQTSHLSVIIILCTVCAKSTMHVVMFVCVRMCVFVTVCVMCMVQKTFIYTLTGQVSS